MARKPRIEYAGAVYHVMARGDRKDLTFRDDQDRRTFLDTLSEVCRRHGWRIHAYVLMDNHYHLLLETPEPNLVVGMKWLQGTYTQRFNRRHEECGHLFQGRYKALVLQSDSGEYFSAVASYIHLNPVRARLMDFAKLNLSEYPWSSFPFYLNGTNRPEWFHVERVLDNFQCTSDRHGMEKFCRMMQKRTLEIYYSKDPMDFDEQWKGIRRGWCLGSAKFRSDMEELTDERISHYDRRSYLGDEAKKHDEAAAQRLLSMGLELMELDEIQLVSLKRNDIRKKTVAWMLRRNTSVKNDWICKKLSMGRSSNLARYVKDIQEDRSPEAVELRKMMKKAF
jgi:putative transposase